MVITLAILNFTFTYHLCNRNPYIQTYIYTKNMIQHCILPYRFTKNEAKKKKYIKLSCINCNFPKNGKFVFILICNYSLIFIHNVRFARSTTDRELRRALQFCMFIAICMFSTEFSIQFYFPYFVLRKSFLNFS